MVCAVLPIIKRLISNIKNRDLFEDIANAGFTRLPDDENGFIVYQNNTTGEVCGFDGADMLRDMFNDIYNEFFHRTEYRIELTTDAFDDMYYISAADSITGEEKIRIMMIIFLCLHLKSLMKLLNIATSIILFFLWKN